MNKWGMTIVRTDNGLLMTTNEGPDEENGPDRLSQQVFEFVDSFESDEHTEAMRRLHYAIDAFFGEIGSKYSKKRLYFEVRHGDSFDCQTPKTCGVCLDERQNDEWAKEPYERQK